MVVPQRRPALAVEAGGFQPAEHDVEVGIGDGEGRADGELAAGEIEVRQLYELEDFEPDVPVERFREIGIGQPARSS